MSEEDKSAVRSVQLALRAALDAEVNSLRLTALKLEREWADTPPLTEVVVSHNVRGKHA